MSGGGRRAAYRPLFVYGTLRRGEAAADVLGAEARRAPARVRGRRLAIRATYPAVVFDPAGEPIGGELVWIERRRFAAVLCRVDAYEGAPALFRRVRVRAESAGETVDAYAYEWAAASPRAAAGREHS